MKEGEGEGEVEGGGEGIETWVCRSVDHRTSGVSVEDWGVEAVKSGVVDKPIWNNINIILIEYKEYYLIEY